MYAGEFKLTISYSLNLFQPLIVYFVSIFAFEKESNIIIKKKCQTKSLTSVAIASCFSMVHAKKINAVFFLDGIQRQSQIEQKDVEWKKSKGMSILYQV